MSLVAATGRSVVGSVVVVVEVVGVDVLVVVTTVVLVVVTTVVEVVLLPSKTGIPSSSKLNVSARRTPSGRMCRDMRSATHA
jgi:hypothetical protein